jgi:hypothetical protein
VPSTSRVCIPETSWFGIYPTTPTLREIFSDVPRDKIDRVVEQVSDRGIRERGAIWFVGDDASLIEDCGHYAIQGSEFLMALAAALCGPDAGEDYRFRLRRHGVPTTLEVDMPASFVPSEQRNEVARHCHVAVPVA